MWVFGYGSLVWRPDFPYIERRPAYLFGWKRRFWQGSTDHRGLPEAPGRVVTLLPDHKDRQCWGMAYSLALDSIDDVVDRLDYRERGGYARYDVPIHFPDRDPASGTVYIATPQNEDYLGPAPAEAIAEQIRRARGPSGDNSEYLLELAEALRAMGADDPHVFTLEQQLRRATPANASRANPAPGPGAISPELSED